MLSLEEITKFEDLALELDSSEYWDKVIDELKERYIFNKYDGETVLRLLFITWFIMLEGECFGYKNINMNDFSNNFIKLYSDTKDSFKDDPNYLLIIGYIMNFTPEYFIKDYSKLNEYENLGREMVKKAFEANPQNIVSESIYRVCFESHEGYNKYQEKYKKNLEMVLEEFFGNRGGMGDYFISIFGAISPEYEKPE